MNIVGTRTSRKLLLVALGPVLTLIVMSLLAQLVRQGIVNCDVSPACRHLPNVVAMHIDPGANFAELRQRLFWGVSLVAVLLTTIMALSVAVPPLFSISGSTRLHLLGVLFAAFVIVAVVAIWESAYDFNRHLLAPLYNAFRGAYYFAAFVEICGLSTLLAAAVSAGLLAFQCAKAQSPGQFEPSNVVAMQIAENRRALTTLLYFVSAALVACTISSNSLYEWAGSYSSFSPYAKEAKQVSATLSSLMGLYYSLMLIGVFFPAYTVLRSLDRKLAYNVGCTAEARNVWRERHGLTATSPRQLGAFFAYIAPLISSGPISAALSAFGHTPTS